MSNCNHEYQDIGYGVERCTKCQYQRVVNQQMFDFYCKHFFNDMKDTYKHIEKLLDDKREYL